MRSYQPYDAWIKDDPPPDLMELIEKYGSYRAIPDSAWDEHHQRLLRWNIRRVTRHW
jgi:hypothetical protein